MRLDRLLGTNPDYQPPELCGMSAPSRALSEHEGDVSEGAAPQVD